MYVEPPATWRRPTTRFAYWIGIRRCPSCTNTTATMTLRPMIGKNSFSVGPPVHHATIPAGALVSPFVQLVLLVVVFSVLFSLEGLGARVGTRVPVADGR
jgi:hypothetical protein